MRNCVYIVYFTMVFLLKNCSLECTHYYLVLNEYFETEDNKEHVNPISMKTISLDYPSFNKTEQFTELLNNRDCILEFKNTPTCMLNSKTSCMKQKDTEKTHDNYIGYDSTTPDYESTTADFGSTTTDYESTTADYGSTTTDYESTTDHESNSTNLSATLVAPENKSEVAKVVGIAAAGVAGTAALGYFITMKIKDMMQYGAYHLP